MERPLESEDEEEFDLRSLSTSLEEVGQCPVCLELVKPPVILCVNGHGMCTSCKASLTKCPTCTKPFSKTEPRILNEILQKIPKVCKYYDNGCRLPAVVDHELYCRFRPVKCIFHKKDNSGYCDWEGLAKDFLGHIGVDWGISNHFELYQMSLWDRELQILKLTNFITPTKARFSYSNYFFYYSKSQENFCLYIKTFPLKKPSRITYFTISLGRDETGSGNKTEYKYKIEATIMITPEREVKPEENVYCMRVPLKELDKMLDANGDLLLLYEKSQETL